MRPNQIAMGLDKRWRFNQAFGVAVMMRTAPVTGNRAQYPGKLKVPLIFQNPHIKSSNPTTENALEMNGVGGALGFARNPDAIQLSMLADTLAKGAFL